MLGQLVLCAVSRIVRANYAARSGNQRNVGLIISVFCSFVILSMLAFPYWQYFELLKQYRKKFDFLIKP